MDSRGIVPILGFWALLTLPLFCPGIDVSAQTGSGGQLQQLTAVAAVAGRPGFAREDHRAGADA